MPTFYVDTGSFSRIESNGTLIISGSNTIITGSLRATDGFTGSLQGTASFAATSSYALNAGAGAGFPFSGSAVITGSLTLISGSDSDNLITIRNTTSPLTFVQITPQGISLNAGGYKTEIWNPLIANFNGGVRLPAGGGYDTLVTTVNGEYADYNGAVTIDAPTLGKIVAITNGLSNLF